MITVLKTLIFDYDGTLHNTAHLYGEAFRKAYSFLVSNGLAPQREYTNEETSVFLGMTPPEMWEKFMPQLDDDMKKTCSEIIGKAMDEYVYENKAVLFDNVCETLDVLKAQSYNMVVLSNCRMAYMDAHRKVFGLDKWFSAYYEAERYNFIKKEDIFLHIKEQFEGEYVMIGDRDKDINVALYHGFKSVGCSYGFGTEEELGKASVCIDDFSKLPEILRCL